jgi:hypothetical protein
MMANSVTDWPRLLVRGRLARVGDECVQGATLSHGGAITPPNVCGPDHAAYGPLVQSTPYEGDCARAPPAMWFERNVASAAGVWPPDEAPRAALPDELAVADDGPATHEH